MGFFDLFKNKHQKDSIDYCKRGEVKYKNGDHTGAEADYNRAIEIDSLSAILYMKRGVLYMVSGKVTAAIEDYSKAIGIEPDIENGYHLRGDAYARIGDKERAIADFVSYGLKPDFAEAYYEKCRSKM
jgi:tetratricopeptide (TPR) repeat protein